MAIAPTNLPRLQGRMLLFFRIAWCAAFAAALFSAVAVTWLEASPSSDAAPGIRTLAERQVGFGLRIFPPLTGKPWRLAKVFSPEALESGLHAGDQVLAIDNLSVDSSTPTSAIAMALGNAEGATTRFRVRSGDGSELTTTLAFHARNVDAWFQGSGLDPWRQFLARRVGYDLMTLLLLAASTMLFLRRSHEPVAAAFAVGFCLIPIGPMVELYDAWHAEPIYQVLSNLPYILILMVGSAFPDGRYWPSWSRFSLWLFPAIFLPALVLIGDYSNFTVVTAPAWVFIVVVLAFRYRRLASGIERQQFRWAALGLTVGVALLLARLPFAFFQADIDPGRGGPWVDLAGSLLHAAGYAVIGLGFCIALLRYRMYDADLLISRSAAIAAATVLIAGIWAASEKAIETLLPSIIGPQYSSLAGIVSAGFAVILVTSLHGHTHRLIERRFQKGVYRLREELPKLIDTMALRFGTSGLCERLLAEIMRDTRTTKGALVVRSDSVFVVAAAQAVDDAEVQPWLSESGLAGATNHGGQTVFGVSEPLVDPIQNEKVGWLLLGSRPDGTNCNRDERAALASLAPAVARAIATAQAIEQRTSPIATHLVVRELGGDTEQIVAGEKKPA